MFSNGDDKILQHIVTMFQNWIFINNRKEILWNFCYWIWVLSSVTCISKY